MYGRSLYEVQRFDYVGVINRILESKGQPVNFSENELTEILSSCKHIFYEQPMLLELEAPLKIVGKASPMQAISTGTSTNWSTSSKCQVIPDKSAISFWVTMSIVVLNLWKLWSCCYATRRDFLKMSFS
jgi:hypothetical protein